MKKTNRRRSKKRLKKVICKKKSISRMKVLKSGIKREKGYLFFSDRKPAIAAVKGKKARETGLCGPNIPKGYKIQNGIYCPETFNTPIPAGKFQAGFEKAIKEIGHLIASIAPLKHYASIKELELTVSFRADGKFIGFGIGGAASLLIRIDPSAA
jgi:hypothetical protein